MVVARPWARLAFALTITITIIAASTTQELYEDDGDEAEEETDPNDEFKNSELLVTLFPILVHISGPCLSNTDLFPSRHSVFLPSLAVTLALPLTVT